MVFLAGLLQIIFLGVSYLRLLPPLWGWMGSMLALLSGLVTFLVFSYLFYKTGSNDSKVSFLISTLYLPALLWIGFSMVGWPVMNDIQSPHLANDVPLYSTESNFRDVIAYPDDLRAELTKSYSYIKPVELPVPAQEVISTLKVWLTEEPGVTVNRELYPHFIQAQFETKVFGFVDDMGFVLDQIQQSDGKYLTRVNMRSRSRLGRGDFGANSVRILVWQARLLEKFTDFDPNLKSPQNPSR